MKENAKVVNGVNDFCFFPKNMKNNKLIEAYQINRSKHVWKIFWETNVHDCDNSFSIMVNGKQTH